MWRRLAIPLFLLSAPMLLRADSEFWTFKPFFVYDPWNTPILPYLATIPREMGKQASNTRALVSNADLANLRKQSVGGRIVKRQLVEGLKTDHDLAHAHKYLLPTAESPIVDIFKVGLGYVDRAGMLGIMETLAKWGCSSNEKCPAKITAKLEVLLARGGAIMKTETFTEINGDFWIVSTITYEVQLGDETAIIPLQSKKLQVQEKSGATR